MAKRSISLFSRSAIIVSITLLISQLIISSLIMLFIVLPVIQHSAITMAAIMKTSTQQWLELPPEKRSDFTHKINKSYNFKLQQYQNIAINTDHPTHEPYVFYLEDALQKELNQFVRFFEDRNNPKQYWINFKYQQQHFEIAIPLHQLGGQPHIIINAIIISLLLLTLIASWFLAYHLNKPIKRMILAVKQVSQGISPDAIPEQGCKEMVVLANSVNTMAKKVDELLENRTIMLAGISHDLRTPLTRMALSVEMLPDTNNPKLIQHIENDIVLMNEMIGHYMELACCLTEEKPEELSPLLLLGDSIQEIQQNSSVQIELNQIPSESSTEKGSLNSIRTYPVALKRIVINLLGNAVRYGQGKPIIVNYETIDKEGKQQVKISIIDQGSGIPENEFDKVFRPFYKVDKSRNSKSGGSGLGLAIVSHLAKAHGWHIGLKTANNGGLVVIIIIPITQ
ncbi:MAG: hypothetical protein GY694_10220 [Gammaproteobacteria bacterium]|nr:hypothetical protein [Gammaproteobacteria bacterium]